MLALRSLISDPDFDLDYIIQRSTEILLDNILTSKDQDPINPSYAVHLAIGSILYSLCFGKDQVLLDDDEYRKILTCTNPSTELFAAGQQVDLLPWIRYFSKGQLHKKNLHQLHLQSP